MSSDSSEDETLIRLREAVDNEFFNNDMFDSKKRKGEQVSQAKQITKPSLRYQEEEINHMRVTEGFQQYVGKQLMKFLDSKIKEVDVPPNKHHVKKDTEGGIRLFGTSPNTLSCDEGIELAASHPQKRMKQKQSRNEKISKEKQCKEVAVPAEWILSKDAVAGWEPSTKGKLEIYSADEVDIKCKKMENKTENALQQVLTPEEKAEKKRLKRKRQREKLKHKLNGENKESLNV